MKFIGAPVQSSQAVKNFSHALTQWQSARPQFLYWSITERVSNGKVGVIALIFDRVLKSRAEIGMILTKASQQHGLSKFAMATVAQHAFSREMVAEITAKHRSHHVAAQRLVERLGYEPIGVDENDYCHWLVTADRMNVPTDEPGWVHGR